MLGEVACGTSVSSNKGALIYLRLLYESYCRGAVQYHMQALNCFSIMQTYICHFHIPFTHFPHPGHAPKVCSRWRVYQTNICHISDHETNRCESKCFAHLLIVILNLLKHTAQNLVKPCGSVVAHQLRWSQSTTRTPLLRSHSAPNSSYALQWV